MRQIALIIMIALFACADHALSEKAAMRSCEDGHIAHSDFWTYCPMCGKKLPKLAKLDLDRLFRTETIIGNKYINKNEGFSIERPSSEYVIEKTAKASQDNSAATMGMESPDDSYYFMIISEEVDVDTEKGIVTFMLNYNEQNIQESFPMINAVEERTVTVGGKTAGQVIYTGPFTADESTPGTGYQAFYILTCIADKKTQHSYNFYAWGPLSHYTSGDAMKTTDFILSTFTLLNE